MREGLLAALDAMERATGEREANVIGCASAVRCSPRPSPT